MNDLPIPLKDQMIIKAEEAVNQQRKRREILEEELAQINAKESEARELLQLLKTGSVATSNGKPKPPGNEEFLEAVEAIGSEFPEWTAAQVAELLGISGGAASQRLRKGAGGTRVQVIKQGGPGIPTTYTLKDK